VSVIVAIFLVLLVGAAFCYIRGLIKSIENEQERRRRRETEMLRFASGHKSRTHQYG
jgi:hypothetical protein